MDTGEGRISLSVIIPVYNTSRWLGECLDSILAQDAFDLEVICVDDGSTDASPEILKEYAGRDSRVRIITQENQGVSVARNAGLDAACGEYIWFLDSDDTINTDAVKAIYRAAADHGKPQVICLPTTVTYRDEGYQGPRVRQGIARETIPRLMGMHTGPETMQILLEEKRYWFWGCMHLYRKDFLDENGLRFLPVLRRHQDVEFAVRVYRDAASVLCIPERVMKHRIREGSNIDQILKKISPEDVRIKFIYILELYKTFAESKALQQNTPSYPVWLTERVKRCQNYYSRLIHDDPEKRKDILFGTDRECEALFDLLIRYPVETGKDLAALSEARKKLSARSYRVYSKLILPARKIVRRIRRG